MKASKASQLERKLLEQEEKLKQIHTKDAEVIQINIDLIRNYPSKFKFTKTF